MRTLSAYLVVLSCFLAGCDQKKPEPTPPQSDAPAAKAESSSTPAAEPQAPKEMPPASAPAGDEVANPVIARNLLTKEEVAAGWISLFDGESLFGWKSTHDDINWTVQDGVITADSGSNGALMTTVPFADYELICEYRMAPGGNSGIFLRSADPPTNPAADFYEVNIVDTHPEGYLTGSLAMRQKANVDRSGGGSWQTLRMIAEGKTLKVYHEGDLVLEFTDESDAPLLNGLIGLQKNSGKIEFRKVNLKPKNLTSLFNGKDLSGWNIVPGNKAEFQVVDESIHVKGGLGFLETEGTYQDFIFQTQAQTKAKDVNSGFFFRTLKGTEAAPSNGYEVQIHHGIKDGNRNQPENAGTGAIFRRVDARRVVGNDFEWSTITLVTSGAQISVWVDGFQVVNWEDQRAPDENPRKGQRLGGGHISLQAHDPTTEVLFKEMFISELPAKK